jgi:hypothetical protein
VGNAKKIGFVLGGPEQLERNISIGWVCVRKGGGCTAELEKEERYQERTEGW